MLMVSPNGLDLIRKFEGTRLKPYFDIAGRVTIGTGHLITAGEATKFAAGITQRQADNLLKHDLLVAENAVARAVKVTLKQGEFDALVSFTFNLGAVRLLASSLRMRLNRGDRQGAAQEFTRWVYAGGRRVSGLMARRMAEKALFMS